MKQKSSTKRGSRASSVRTSSPARGQAARKKKAIPTSCGRRRPKASQEGPHLPRRRAAFPIDTFDFLDKDYQLPPTTVKNLQPILEYLQQVQFYVPPIVERFPLHIGEDLMHDRPLREAFWKTFLYSPQIIASYEESGIFTVLERVNYMLQRLVLPDAIVANQIATAWALEGQVHMGQGNDPKRRLLNIDDTIHIHNEAGSQEFSYLNLLTLRQLRDCYATLLQSCRKPHWAYIVYFVRIFRQNFHPGLKGVDAHSNLLPDYEDILQVPMDTFYDMYTEPNHYMNPIGRRETVFSTRALSVFRACLRAEPEVNAYIEERLKSRVRHAG